MESESHASEKQPGTVAVILRGYISRYDALRRLLANNRRRNSFAGTVANYGLRVTRTFSISIHTRRFTQRVRVRVSP